MYKQTVCYPQRSDRGIIVNFWCERLANRRQEDVKPLNQHFDVILGVQTGINQPNDSTSAGVRLSRLIMCC